LTGNLSDFITDDHLSAREAKLVFGDQKRVKFSAANNADSCPLDYLTFEANNDDNRESDEFDIECEKTVVTSEILIRFTSIDGADLNTDNIIYEISNSTTTEDVEMTDVFDIGEEGSADLKLTEETIELTQEDDEILEEVAMEAETSPDINFNEEETPDSSIPVSKFEQVEDIVNEDYEIIKEEIELVTTEDTIRNILMTATYMSLFTCSLALSGLILMKWKRTVMARLWIKDLRRVVDGNKAAKEKMHKPNRFCNDDVIITANTEVFRTA